MPGIFGTLPRKTAVTVLICAAFAAATLVPLPARPKPPIAVERLPVQKPAPVAIPNLEVPPGSLDDFYVSLRRTESKQPGAVTRILHYGDSPTTADSITSDVRRLLQARFGDAGHGWDSRTRRRQLSRRDWSNIARHAPG